MKEHIDEMAKVLIDYTNKNHIMASHVILEDYAEALYNAGYRKQSENTIEFPCKVGDKAWFVFTPRFPANPSDKGKWFMVEDGVQRLIYGAKGVSIETWNMGTISAREIGKKLFFTKEEAEKVLAKMKGGVNDGWINKVR